MNTQQITEWGKRVLNVTPMEAIDFFKQRAHHCDIGLRGCLIGAGVGVVLSPYIFKILIATFCLVGWFLAFAFEFISKGNDPRAFLYRPVYLPASAVMGVLTAFVYLCIALLPAPWPGAPSVEMVLLSGLIGFLVPFFVGRYKIVSAV